MYLHLHCCSEDVQIQTKCYSWPKVIYQKLVERKNAAYQKTISTEQMATASCKMVFGNFIYYLWPKRVQRPPHNENLCTWSTPQFFVNLLTNHWIKVTAIKGNFIGPHFSNIAGLRYLVFYLVFLFQKVFWIECLTELIGRQNTHIKIFII